MLNGDIGTPEQTVLNGISAGAAPPSGKAIYQQRKQYGRTSVNSSEISQYNVEHLTTFPIERKEGMLTVEDGIRKLKLMDARGKIWTQEALMQVDDKAVKLFDQTSQEELENFPLTTIQHIQAVGDAEPYSVLAIVAKDSDQKNPDMHLFHCPNVPADIVSADIESAIADCKDKKGRKVRPETLKRTRERVQASVIPPPPLAPPPAPPMKDGDVRKRIQSWDNIAQVSDMLPIAPEYSELPAEVMAQKVNRDVQILNHTLDDIEIFVSQLQKSAEAKRELHARKGNKKNKGRRKHAGDGMLTLRAKLPPVERFVECFRKFKFGFNLATKLKNHIHNPNAIEITHFLFSPLEMCIRACGGRDIPRSVESPLFTRDTIDFLHNCLTTRELDLWRGLGEYWTMSRQEFPKEHYFPPYIPQFYSGWQPPPLRSSNEVGEESAKEIAASIALQADRVSKAEARRISDTSAEAFKQHVEQHVQRNQTANNTHVMSYANGGDALKRCRSMYDITGRNKNELSVARDELLTVLEDNKAWWRVQNDRGQVGFVPSNHMILISHHKTPSSNGSDSGAPSVSPPLTPIAPVPPPPPPLIPVAPPPPAVKVMPVPMSPRRESNGKVNGTREPVYSAVKKKQQNPKGINLDGLQQELMGRVNKEQAQQRNFSIPKKKANSSSLKITKDSTKDDVKKFLESMGFSQLTIDSLGVLTGAQLFTLTKEELKMICEDEGARVYSQLQVQKSQMTSKQSSESELEKKLRMQKAKAETN